MELSTLKFCLLKREKFLRHLSNGKAWFNFHLSLFNTLLEKQDKQNVIIQHSLSLIACYFYFTMTTSSASVSLTKKWLLIDKQAWCSIN